MFKIVIEAESISELKDKLCETYEQEIATGDVPSIRAGAGEVLEKILEEAATPAPLPGDPIDLTSTSEHPAPIVNVVEQPIVNLEDATRASDQDVRGVKWDKSIHASTKAIQKDGTWRKRRGVDHVEVAKIEAEQKASAQPVTPTPAVPGISVAEVAHRAEVQEITAPLRPAPIVAPVAPPVQIRQPLVASGHTLATFQANIVTVLADLVEKEKITHEYIRQLCGFFEVAEIYEVFNDAEKSSQLFEEFVKNGLIAKVA